MRCRPVLLQPCVTRVDARATTWTGSYSTARLARLPAVQTSLPTIVTPRSSQHLGKNVSANNTKMSEVTAADRQNAVLGSARKLYSDGKFKAALAGFKEALLRCPCTRDVLVQSKKLGLSLKDIQISRCHCKDFEALLASDPTQLAMYRLAKRHCTCGSDVFHCNVPSHLNALDGIIATLEKLEAPDKARQYATLLIITCPRAPEGYLRLAKALRLCDTQQTPDTITRCRRIYRQAIQSVQTYGNKDHPKLKTLATLLRMDIVGSLPPELQLLILKYLNNANLCRAMRVSKTWKRICLDPNLWRILIFEGSRKPLRKGVFNTIVSQRAQGKVKALTLGDVMALGIELPVFKATLKLLVQLESLDLTGQWLREDHDGSDWARRAPASDAWSTVLFEEAPPSLKTLIFRGFRPSNELRPISAIPMAQSLEELQAGNLISGSAIIRSLNSTMWPRLRRLELTSGTRRTSMWIDLQTLASVTPSLKHLCIRTLHALVDDDDDTPSWEGLERLELTLRTDLGTILGATPSGILPAGSVPAYLSLPQLRPLIRSLEFPERGLAVIRSYERIAWAYSQRPPGNRALPPVKELERLEHLYLRDSDAKFQDAGANLAALSWFTELIKPSMSNGSFTSLAITFSAEMHFAFDKVLNKTALRTLSCFDFIDEEPGGRCGGVFATWVRQFTHLTALGVFPQRTENCWMHVMKVMLRETSIRIIYTNVLSGVCRDGVLEKAAEKGIKVVESLSRIPEEGQPLCPSDILSRFPDEGHFPAEEPLTTSEYLSQLGA